MIRIVAVFLLLLLAACSHENNIELRYRAQLEGDANICNKIDSINERDICFWSIAGKSNDLDLCDDISDGHLKNKCISSVARRRNDTSICTMTGDYESTCMDYVLNWSCGCSEVQDER